MKLLKVLGVTSFASATKILSALIIVKIIAIYIGPEGLGKIGQFLSLMTVITVLAGGGIGNGVTKYIAEFNNNNKKVTFIINNGLGFTVICSFIMGLVAFFFAKPFSWLLFHDSGYVHIVQFLAIMQLLIALNNTIIAIINGFKDYHRLTLLTIIGTFLGLLALVFTTIKFHVEGALFGIILFQTLPIIPSLVLLIKAPWFKLTFLNVAYNIKQYLCLAKYSSMAITTAIVTPIAQIIIRNYIAHYFSWASVGYWQGVTRISDVYLLFITTALTSYYMPQLSELKNSLALKNEIINAYKTIIPITFLLTFLIYFSRYSIINILFSKSFSPMASLFLFQLIGDFIKICAWLLSFLMIAKAMTKTYIISEIFFNSTFILFAIVLSKHLGIEGLTMAFAINCFFYLITMFIIFKNVLKF